MRKFLPGLLAAALLMPVAASAQQQDRQFWFQANTNIPLTNRVHLTLEQLARFSDRQDGLFQTQFGGILGYKVADHFELGFGYRRVGSHNNNRNPDDDRLRQHIVATFGRVTTRLRVEERFHPDGHEIGFSVRPFIRYNQPLRAKGVSLFASHESYFLPNSTRWGQRSGYDRIRDIAGVGFPLVKGVHCEIGYLNDYRFARGGSRARMDHALNLQLNISLGTPRRHKTTG